METCPYCDIIEGKQFCHKIWENEDFLAFLSIFPNTDGFTILITKQHYPAYIFDLPDELLFKFIQAAKTVAKLLDTKLEDVGRTGLIVESTGIDHAHIKLIPMHGTANIAKWQPPIAYLDKYFKKYEGYLSSHDSTRRTDKELEKIAKKIRLQ
jgi:diadenosine tetraphosphate (Ap4A) HIT family hydrolase